MIFDKNQTEFPSEKHKTIWYCGVLVLPEELSLSDKVKALLDTELFESCKQMRLFILHSLSEMYDNLEDNSFDPYQYVNLWLNIFANVLDEEVFDNDGVIISSKRSFPFATKMIKLYGKVLANTGVEIKINDNSVKITNALYPKMFRAIKEMQKYVRVKKERASLENSFTLCDFRKICPEYKYDKPEKRAYMREIEDRIPLIMESSTKPMALEFATYLRDRKINLKWTGIQNSYSTTGQVYGTGKGICFIGFGDAYNEGRNKKDGWVIGVTLENMNQYETELMDKGLHEFILDNIYFCDKTPKSACNGGEGIHACRRGKDLMILGKEVEYICRLRNRKHISVYVYDPDKTTIDKIKTLLELEQEARTKL